MDLTNLQAFWELGEASGTRNDSHGTNHLTDNNTVSSTTGKVGNAADFERDNTEYLSIADNAALSMGDIDFSIAGWVQFESLTADDQVLISKGDLFAYATAEFSLELTASDLLRFYVGDGTASDSVIDIVTISTATWYFFYAYHEAATNQMGISVNDGTVTTGDCGGSYDSGLELTLGRWANFAGGYHDGLLDQVGIWKRLLTPAEVTFLYNSGSGRSYAEMLDNVYLPWRAVIKQAVSRGSFY
jgi:Concanavalin A-like lectin/glucanases superfamily